MIDDELKNYFKTTRKEMLDCLNSGCRVTGITVLTSQSVFMTCCNDYFDRDSCDTCADVRETWSKMFLSRFGRKPKGKTRWLTISKEETYLWTETDLCSIRIFRWGV